MKRFYLLSIVTMALVLCCPVTTSCASCTDGSYTTNTNPAKLPQAAQAVLNKHFAGKEILLTKQDREWTRRYYDVIFVDGSKIEFDSNGQWTEIDCLQGAVPDALVPQQILTFVKKKFPNCQITQIDRDRRGYDVDLSNGLEIEFNKNFQVIDIDD